MLLLFLLGHLLLEHEKFEMRFFFFLEFTFFLTLTDVRLEIFKLLLSGSFAFLVVVDWLWNGLYRSVTNGNKDRLIVFALFFSL